MAYENEFAVLSSIRTEIGLQPQLAALKDILQISTVPVMVGKMQQSFPVLTLSNDTVKLQLEWVGKNKSIILSLVKGGQKFSAPVGPHPRLSALAARNALMLLIANSTAVKKLFTADPTPSFVNSVWPELEDQPYPTYVTSSS